MIKAQNKISILWRMDKTFRLYWIAGVEEIVHGKDIADACRRAGIGNRALRVIDHWEEVDTKSKADLK